MPSPECKIFPLRNPFGWRFFCADRGREPWSLPTAGGLSSYPVAAPGDGLPSRRSEAGNLGWSSRQLLALFFTGAALGISALPAAAWPGKGPLPDYYQWSWERFADYAPAQQALDAADWNQNLLEAALFHATNKARQEQGKSLLLPHPGLQQAARFHSQAMRKQSFFSHEHPQARWREPRDRIQHFADALKKGAENIAQTTIYPLGEEGRFYRDEQDRLVDPQGQVLQAYSYWALAQKIVQQWLQSPGHRRNLLGSYEFLGCGVTFKRQSQVPVVLCTQNLASS